MTRRVTPALLVALRLKPCASLFPTYSTDISPLRVWSAHNTGVDRSALLWAASAHQADPMLAYSLPTSSMAKPEEKPPQLQVAFNGSPCLSCIQKPQLWVGSRHACYGWESSCAMTEEITDLRDKAARDGQQMSVDLAGMCEYRASRFW